MWDCLTVVAPSPDVRGDSGNSVPTGLSGDVPTVAMGESVGWRVAVGGGAEATAIWLVIWDGRVVFSPSGG